MLLLFFSVVAARFATEISLTSVKFLIDVNSDLGYIPYSADPSEVPDILHKNRSTIGIETRTLRTKHGRHSGEKSAQAVHSEVDAASGFNKDSPYANLTVSVQGCNLQLIMRPSPQCRLCERIDLDALRMAVLIHEHGCAVVGLRCRGE
jgi:hypothetical protein